MTALSDALAALRPCPFCGGTAEFVRVGNHRVSTQIQCTECGVSMETGEEAGTASAPGKYWNTRTADRLSKAAQAGESDAPLGRCFECEEPLSTFCPKCNAPDTSHAHQPVTEKPVCLAWRSLSVSGNCRDCGHPKEAHGRAAEAYTEGEG